jgi:hypothetical protein
LKISPFNLRAEVCSNPSQISEKAKSLTTKGAKERKGKAAGLYANRGWIAEVHANLG